MVFDGRDAELDACIARLSVLFEDLFLELTEAGRTDSKTFRRFYFVRKSVGTLREFVEALLHLDGIAGFQPIRQRFNTGALGRWNSAINQLRGYQRRIYEERNA